MKRLLTVSLVILLLFAAAAFAGCRGKVPDQGNFLDHDESKTAPQEIPEEEPLENDKNNGDDDSYIEEKSEEESRELSREELHQYCPNELGEVMILMYHHIGYPESEWTRTPENFRQDLKELYRQGYRTVSLLDYVRGEIDIPAGTSPVVLTFDDSSRGQFNYIEGENGPVIDPDSAVGIMEDFYRQHPEFGRAATFYIYYPLPFGQRDYIENKLLFLQDNGYEIGNHSYSHANLSNIASKEVQKELAQHARKTEEFLPGYQVRSLALPFGIFPENRELVKQAEYEGYRYENEAVLLVGYRPAPSPFSLHLDPYRLPRIRASEMKVEGVGLYDWLSYFEANPERRYISDGSQKTLTAPEDQEHKLNQKAVGDRQVIFYSLNEDEN